MQMHFFLNLIVLSSRGFQPQLSEMQGAGGRGDALTGGAMGKNGGTRRLDGSLNPLVMPKSICVFIMYTAW